VDSVADDADRTLEVAECRRELDRRYEEAEKMLPKSKSPSCIGGFGS